MKTKSIIGALFVVMLLITGFLGFQLFQLTNNIEGLDSRVSKQMDDITKQWSQLTALDNKISAIQKEVKKHRLTADLLASQVNQLQDDLKTLSGKHDLLFKWSAKQWTKLHEEKQMSNPILGLIPQEELAKMNSRVESSQSKGELILINDSSWTVKSITMESGIPNSYSFPTERHTFQFKNLVLPTHQGKASVDGEITWGRCKWRIVSGVGYEGYWYDTDKLAK